MWRFRAGIRTYWITLELHDGGRVIHVGATGGGVSVWIRSRRAAYAKCNNAQADSREYQGCCEYFFHSFVLSESPRLSKRFGDCQPYCVQDITLGVRLHFR